jgi:hypothetical protein
MELRGFEMMAIVAFGPVEEHGLHVLTVLGCLEAKHADR